MGRHFLLWLGIVLWTIDASAQSVVETIPAETETDWSRPSFWETVDGEAAEPIESPPVEEPPQEPDVEQVIDLATPLEAVEPPPVGAGR